MIIHDHSSDNFEHIVGALLRFCQLGSSLWGDMTDMMWLVHVGSTFWMGETSPYKCPMNSPSGPFFGHHEARRGKHAGAVADPPRGGSSEPQATPKQSPPELWACWVILKDTNHHPPTPKEKIKGPDNPTCEVLRRPA